VLAFHITVRFAQLERADRVLITDGYEIVNALVTDLQPDHNVLNAMNQIEAQRRMRMAAQEKAEADKILIVKAAEADAESKYLSGAGVARQRRAIVDGLKESVMDFNDSVVGTTPTDVMQLMMVTQYLDMLKEVGSRDKATTLFIPHSPSAINDIQGQMRQGFMEANLSAASSTRPVVARPTRD
jgi:regulator of protease activity HflC (stomatin/prohibitin superfamily)